MAGNQYQVNTNNQTWMSLVLSRDNLKRALTQVCRNKGGAGIDGMTVDELPAYLKHHWQRIKTQLMAGEYRPNAIKRVNIPKPDGRQRKLGIPTVVDRFIQQAISQVLSSYWDRQFHPNSYGFRPNRSAHDAIYHVQGISRRGKTHVVDIDLASFFDEVNHDKLMQKLKADCHDRDLLRLINRYLKCEVSIDGKKSKVTKGVPQGGPLSPILSNIMLNELDWELQKRGHEFARYADDCQIYVGSQQAAERVKRSVSNFIDKYLRLKVNDEKSAVRRPWTSTFLGFTLSKHQSRLKVSQKSLKTLKLKLRTLSRRTRGHSIVNVIADIRKYLLGWKAYFGVAEVLSPLQDIDKWLRRKLRCYLLKQWGRTGYRQLRRRGIDRRLAWNTCKSAKGPWRLSGSKGVREALPNRYFIAMGLPSISR